MLQLELPLGPLMLRLLSQEVDGNVTVGEGARVSWPVVFAQHLGTEGGEAMGQLWTQPVTDTPASLIPNPPCPSFWFLATLMRPPPPGACFPWLGSSTVTLDPGMTLRTLSELLAPLRKRTAPGRGSLLSFLSAQ